MIDQTRISSTNKPELFNSIYDQCIEEARITCLIGKYKLSGNASCPGALEQNNSVRKEMWIQLEREAKNSSLVLTNVDRQELGRTKCNLAMSEISLKIMYVLKMTDEDMAQVPPDRVPVLTPRQYDEYKQQIKQ